MKTLTLIPTTDCNLRCSFCLCLESLGKNKGSSVKDMIDFVRLYLDLYPTEEFTVEFFGGEPTLAYEAIKEVYNTIIEEYPKRSIHWMLFTNGVFNVKVVRDFDFFASMFDEIIVSHEGPTVEVLDRHPSQKTYDKAIDNLKRLLPYNNTGVAFVVFPSTPLGKVFHYFRSLGVRYFNFEIVTHVNNDKNSGVTNPDILRVIEFIYHNILQWNVEHPKEYRLFTIPRELLSSSNFYKNPSHKSCLDSVRALAPSGNIYPCRDMAANEYKLTQQSDLIYSDRLMKPFNIKDFQLDRDRDTFLEEFREYDKWTSCPVKSIEHHHFIGGSMPWLKDKDFQDLIIYPTFVLSWMLFKAHKDGYTDDPKFLEYYKERVDLLGVTISEVRGRFED